MEVSESESEARDCESGTKSSSVSELSAKSTFFQSPRSCAQPSSRAMSSHFRSSPGSLVARRSFSSAMRLDFFAGWSDSSRSKCNISGVHLVDCFDRESSRCLKASESPSRPTTEKVSTKPLSCSSTLNGFVSRWSLFLMPRKAASRNDLKRFG